jgi:predicted GNAT family acetyltransferase
MRTAPFAPYPPFLLPMPDEAAVALARTLHERGEGVLAVNGALPAVELFAAELARLSGGHVQVSQHTRLHELGELVCPAPVPGGLRAATEDDVELVMEWFGAFMGDADEQAGRSRGSSAHDVPGRADMLRRLRTGRLWFWVNQAGERVHLTGVRVARVGPVYTPPAQRGRGWASNAVAELFRRTQAEGARVCLFTDLANPTSNKIYAAIGYQPAADMANLVIAR